MGISADYPGLKYWLWMGISQNDFWVVYKVVEGQVGGYFIFANICHEKGGGTHAWQSFNGKFLHPAWHRQVDLHNLIEKQQQSSSYDHLKSVRGCALYQEGAIYPSIVRTLKKVDACWFESFLQSDTIRSIFLKTEVTPKVQMIFFEKSR